ncbi:MAG: aldehyde dehydrogenase [Anaerovoracaceae bacterium]|jgi:aldehyde dehydrogenase (NAD+)
MNDKIETLIVRQRTFFETGVTKSVAFRREQLSRLKKSIIENENHIMDALKADLNKAPFEAFASEIGVVLKELSYMLSHVGRLSRPKRVAPTLAQFPASCRIIPEPYGVVLVMSPWNYPFLLTLSPVIGAMAAGNCILVKPSNYSPNVSKVIGDIIRGTFPSEYIDMVEGGREVNTSLLVQRFDYIFFTGSETVGKTVMAAAAKNLTPVTLELGGKSPCIVDETANIFLAAKRISWGKFLNAGQTCIAPDYILVHNSVKELLIEEILHNIHEFYGEKPHMNEELPRIITKKHFERLLALISSESDVCGGSFNVETMQIEPTLLTSATWESAAMGEEIFGPVLPVLTYNNLEDAITRIKMGAKPLALYLFTGSGTTKQMVLEQVSFGGGCINDTVMHMPTTRMPFGGVGQSGMGAYHGKTSFLTFSHMKSLLIKGTFIDVPLRYPPYKNKLPLVKRLMR